MASVAPMRPPFGSNGNPVLQNFTWYDSAGDAINLTIADLDSVVDDFISVSINYASQLGASLILLIVVILLTKADKRGSPIFMLNTLSLTLSFIRNLLQCLYFTSGFSELYALFSGDYFNVSRSDYATSVAAGVIVLLLLIAIESSLVLQIHVITTTMHSTWRLILMTVSMLIALTAVGFRFAFCVENSKAILATTSVVKFKWLYNATIATETASICYFCAVFTIKLGFAFCQRRKLGLRQFAPMQIIFIMGLQTMVIPAVFTILQYFVHAKGFFSSAVLTVTAILLPLSSLWASASSNRPASPSLPTSQRKLFSWGLSSNGPSKHSTATACSSSTSTAYVHSNTTTAEDSKVTNNLLLSPASSATMSMGSASGAGGGGRKGMRYPYAIKGVAGARGLEIPEPLDDDEEDDDIEGQRRGLGDGVRVERSFSVNSDRAGTK